MKNKNPFMICHIILMAALILICGITAVMMIGGFGFDGTDRLHLLFRGIFNVMSIFAMLIGLLYILNEYGKPAAKYYKAFMFLQIIETILLVLIELMFSNIDIALIFGIAILIDKVIILSILVFKKDLGKTNTWSLFYVMLFLDIVGVTLTMINNSSKNLLFFSIAAVIVRLTLDGTVGLSIRGKYADKASRNTK